MANRYIIILLLLISVASSNTLKSVKLKGNSIVLNFLKPVKKNELKAFIIPNKSIIKYVFDFKNSIKSKSVKNIKKPNRNIKSIRISQYKPFTVRVVIDSLKKYSISYSQKNGSSNFIITLPTKLSIKKATKRNKKTLSIKSVFNQIENKKTSVKKSSLKVKDIHISSVKLKNRYKILIDPGHGAHDSGAVGHGYKEKNVALQIGKRLYKKLKRQGFSVSMTRYGNKFVKLSKRTQLANKIKADLFISIHANSIKNKKRANKVHGIETYFLDKARTARAKRIASAENRMLLKSQDSNTKKVLLNAVFVGPKVQLSNRLAIDVQRHILSSLKGRYNYIKDNGVRGGPFRVLVGAQMPAILVETGYISNTKESRRLANGNYQEVLAAGIARGVINYFKNREKELE